MREGCQNGAQLWREITQQGFCGSASLVRQFVAARRTYPPSGGTGIRDWTPKKQRSKSQADYCPSPRQCAFL